MANRLLTVHVTLDAAVAAALSGRVTDPAVTGTVAPPVVRQAQSPTWT